MNTKSLNIGQVGITPVEIPYLEIGSGSPVGTILALQHGGEWSPLWVIKEVIKHQTEIKGTIRIIPVANPFGFIAGTRNETIEGSNLNREYPGNPHGNFSARLAHAIFTLCKSSDFVIDLHTFDRQSPFLVGYMKQIEPQPKVQKLIQLLSPDVVWVVDDKDNEDRKFKGCLFAALTEVLVPSVFVEMPNYQSITPELIFRISQGLINVFTNYSSELKISDKKISEFKTKCIYPDNAGLFEPLVKLLETVAINQPIGEIYTLPKFERTIITTPYAGTIITIKGRSVVRTGTRLASIGTQLT